MIMPVMTMPVMTMVVMVMVVVVMVVVVIVVIVMTMTVVVMAMMMRMLVRGRIAIVRLERCRHRLRLESAFLQQQRNLRHVGDAQAVRENLHRYMAIAEREDQSRALGEILLAHLEHRLDLGDDLDEPAVVEHQEIVGAQQRGRREIEFDASALAAEHEALLLDAVLVSEQHGIDDVALGFSGADDFLGARHGMIRFSDGSGARRRRARRRAWRRTARRPADAPPSRRCRIALRRLPAHRAGCAPDRRERRTAGLRDRRWCRWSSPPRGS